MAEIVTIARPYAKAIFAHSCSVHAEPAWSVFLNKAALISSDVSMAEVLKNPAVSAEEKVSILSDLTADVVVEGCDALIKTLAHYGRLSALHPIATEFESLLAEGQQALEVTIASAYPLEAEEIQLLESKLKSRYREKTIRIETVTDHSLIGGFEIRSSDTVIDATVRGRLAKIAETLTN